MKLNRANYGLYYVKGAMSGMLYADDGFGNLICCVPYLNLATLTD